MSSYSIYRKGKLFIETDSLHKISDIVSNFQPEEYWTVIQKMDWQPFTEPQLRLITKWANNYMFLSAILNKEKRILIENIINNTITGYYQNTDRCDLLKEIRLDWISFKVFHNNLT